jgi:hypothetical protein
MNQDIRIINSRSVSLCCGKKNCPVVTELADGMIEITDDYGNKIRVKKEEAALISDGVQTIQEQKLILG